MLDRLTRFLFRPVVLARLFFILLTTWCGLMLAEKKMVDFLGISIHQQVLYSLVAIFAALLITIVEYATDAISSHKILMAAVGMMAGLLFAQLFYPVVPANLASNSQNIRLVCSLFFGYFGIVLAIKHAERFHLSRLSYMFSRQQANPKILDTSVIIDGRIRELIELQVVRGAVLIPAFVLREMQAIADSSDSNRKARGRRGLDVLANLRETCKTLEIIDKDFPELGTVDQKLIQLCREMQADLVTNDFNLQKIAQLHRITVLNINEMANALKPTVYIGENFQLTVVRPGKEANQGIGYLDDGTLVVVDGALPYMHQEVEVGVSSILQTSSGRMVFARLQEDEQPRAVTQRAEEVRSETPIRARV